MQEGKQLQTGFQFGMERMLGVNQSQQQIYDSVGHPSMADVQDQDEGLDRARDRYQRQFWEPVVEGEEPVVPKALEQAKKDAAKKRRATFEAKSDPLLLTDQPNARKVQARSRKVVYASSDADPSRPTIRFEDVGGKFLDVADRVRRMKNSDRRKSLQRGTGSS